MKINKLISLLIVLITLGGCTDNFDELAKNPNATEEVIPSMLFTGVALDMVSSTYGKTFFSPSLVSRQTVWTENIHSTQYYYAGRSSFWAYGTLRDVQRMVTEAERTEEEVYAGLGHFFTANFLFETTIAFGDIPYSDAMKGETEGLYLPKYDLQEDVFVGILDELEKANNILSQTDDLLIGDVVFDGDILKWRKAVNSFALKVLINLSKKEGSSKIDISGKFNQIVSNPEKYPVFESLDDNVQLVYRDKGGERYPFWNHTHKQYPHLDKSFVDMLKRFQDKRLFYYGAPTGEALGNGLQPDDFNAYEGGDGTDEFDVLLDLESSKKMSRIHPRYYEDFDNEPYINMGYGELQFILAEGAYRGWISGDAASYYNEGIKASMVFLRTHGRSYDGISLSNEWMDEYVNGVEVKYDASKGLEQIITQKYIASFLNSGWSTYYENRRTGFPEFKVNPATSLNIGYENQIPTRWMYPQKELNYNKENVEEAIKRQFGEDNVNAKMWLIK